MFQPSSWRARPVFVSSTFNDMHAERDHLQQYVFPELAERLRAHRHHLEIVDLRWGVETGSFQEQHAKELLVLKVCFAEIERSRPFMIALLGHRYGWTPPSERVAAAAGEAAFDLDGGPHSITALELEYGALRSPERAGRSFFYLREPHPYAQMPAEVAARYTDEGRDPAAFARLEALKARLEQQFPTRVRRYRPGWDPARGRLVGLEAFGARVLDDLWSAMREELRLDDAAPADWQAEEQQLLDAFVEELSRNFSGREELLAHTVDEVTRAGGPGAPAAVVLAGASGSGKSALFAAVVRALPRTNGVLLLTHGAGVSPRSVHVEPMLRRWCALLSGALGVQDESERVSGVDRLREHFVARLRAASSVGRVVMMVDALNEFERSPAGRYLTWLPAPHEWPAGVSLFATTVPGTELRVLRSLGAAVRDLPPLSAEESIEISERICTHFHKTLPEGVKAALLQRTLPDGGRAAGSPLWLTLAVNELLVLDADDFARLPELSGTPEEQLLELLVRTVHTLPPDVWGAYDFVFTRVEGTYGAARVQAILSLLVASRFGLRESDLQLLLPAAGGMAWDTALFAAIRRAMRSHLHQYAEAGKWAFTHPRVREAAAARYFADPERRRAFHRHIAEHLAGLPDEDEMRHERMYHLIQADEPEAAAVQLVSVGDDPATRALFAILRDFLHADQEGRDAVHWLASLLSVPLRNEKAKPDVANTVLFYTIGERLLEFTEAEALAQDEPELLGRLLRATCAIVEERLREEPEDAMAQQVLYRHLQNLALVQMRLGEEDAALEALTRSGDISERHARGRRAALDQNTGLSDRERKIGELFFKQNERDRMLNFWRVGDLYTQRREPEKAQAQYERAMTLGRWFLEKYPDSPLARSDMALNHQRLGQAAFNRADLPGARTQYGACVEFCTWLREHDRADRSYGAMFVQAHVGLGRALAHLGEAEAAHASYTHALEACLRMVREDPGDLGQQRALLDLYQEWTRFYSMYQDAASALRFVLEGARHCTALIHTAGATPELRQYLKHCYEMASLLLNVQGDVQAASEYARRAAEVEPAVADGAARP